MSTIIEAAEKAMECFATAGDHLDQFCKVTEVDGRFFWYVRFPKGHKMYQSMTFGNQEIVLDTIITPCDNHLAMFEDVTS